MAEGTNIIAQRKSRGNLLDYVRSFAPDKELADRLEEVLEERQKIRLGRRGTQSSCRLDTRFLTHLLRGSTAAEEKLRYIHGPLGAPVPLPWSNRQ